MRIRFRLQTMMIVVGVVGLGLGLVRLGQRRVLYRELAAYHQKMEAGHWHKSRYYTEPALRDFYATDLRCELHYYHALLKEKYQHAATYPWDMVKADPPGPPDCWIIEAVDNRPRRRRKRTGKSSLKSGANLSAFEHSKEAIQTPP